MMSRKEIATFMSTYWKSVRSDSESSQYVALSVEHTPSVDWKKKKKNTDAHFERVSVRGSLRTGHLVRRKRARECGLSLSIHESCADWLRTRLSTAWS